MVAAGGLAGSAAGRMSRAVWVDPFWLLPVREVRHAQEFLLGLRCGLADRRHGSLAWACDTEPPHTLAWWTGYWLAQEDEPGRVARRWGVL
jgi:hypothetical protein